MQMQCSYPCKMTSVCGTWELILKNINVSPNFLNGFHIILPACTKLLPLYTQTQLEKFQKLKRKIFFKQIVHPYGTHLTCPHAN